MCPFQRVSHGVRGVSQSRSLVGEEGRSGPQAAPPRERVSCHRRSWVSGVVSENWVCGESVDVEVKINILRTLVLTGRYPCIYFQSMAV